MVDLEGSVVSKDILSYLDSRSLNNYEVCSDTMMQFQNIFFVLYIFCIYENMTL